MFLSIEHILLDMEHGLISTEHILQTMKQVLHLLAVHGKRISQEGLAD
jgi:hypothetical protein